MSVLWGMRRLRSLAVCALLAVTVANFVILHQYAGKSKMLRRITGFVMAGSPLPTAKPDSQEPHQDLVIPESHEIAGTMRLSPEVSPSFQDKTLTSEEKSSPSVASVLTPSMQPPQSVGQGLSKLNRDSPPIFPNLKPEKEYFVKYALQMSQGSIGVPFRIVVMNAGHGKHEEFDTVKQVHASNPVFEFVHLPETDTLDDIEKPPNRRLARLYVYDRLQDSWSIVSDTDVDRYDLHVLRLKDGKIADDLIGRTQKWCKRRQDCQGFVHVTTPDGRQESFLKSKVSEDVRKPYSELLLPEVVQQSLDVIRLAKYCAINSQFVMFLEDDFYPCPNALQTSIAVLETAVRCHPKGGPTSIGTVVTCRGMNGVAIEAHRVPQFTSALRNSIYSTPCDLLVYDPGWISKEEPWKYPQVLYQTNLFEHIGDTSSFAFRNSKPFLDSEKDVQQRNVKCDTVQPGWKKAKSGVLAMDGNVACNFVQNVSPSPAPSPETRPVFPPLNPETAIHQVARPPERRPRAQRKEGRVF